MEFGERRNDRGMRRVDDEELQMRFDGFHGTVPDGGFGPGTELQVVTFQDEYMHMRQPTGVVDQRTYTAIQRLAEEYPLDFNALRCPCGECAGFGRGRFKRVYMTGSPK